MTRYDGPMSDPAATDRDVAIGVIRDTMRRHGIEVVDAGEWQTIHLDLATALAALHVVASSGATDADRAKALALVAELGGRYGIGDGEDSGG